jgi:hypothetical protein
MIVQRSDLFGTIVRTAEPYQEWPEKKDCSIGCKIISYIQEIIIWFFFTVIDIFLPLDRHKEEIALPCIMALPEFIIDELIIRFD